MSESKKKEHARIGSDFDDFLKEEGIYDKVKAGAIKKVIALKLQEAMDKQGMSKAALARKMGTSRSSLDRLLDPGNESVTLQTIVKAANALGKKVTVAMS